GWLASLANLDELMQRGRPEHDDEFLTKAREFLDKKTEIKATLDNFESCLNLLGRVPVHPGLLSQHHQPQQPRRGSSSFRPRRASSPAAEKLQKTTKKATAKPHSCPRRRLSRRRLLLASRSASAGSAASSWLNRLVWLLVRSLCLLAWISSQDGGSGEAQPEDSGSGLHRLRDALDRASAASIAVDQLNEEFRKCVARSSDISYREVRGLEDRLLELNRLADDALQLAAGQAESARGFRANQERWLSLRGDPSLLADLPMAKQHDALRDKRLRILRSKEEFTINLHRRLNGLAVYRPTRLKLHDRERTVRKELAHTLRSHLLRLSQPELRNQAARETWDTGLPRVTRSDLEALAVRVPELRPASHSARENVPAEEVFRKFRRFGGSCRSFQAACPGATASAWAVRLISSTTQTSTRPTLHALQPTQTPPQVVIRPRSCGSVEFLIGPCSLRTGAHTSSTAAAASDTREPQRRGLCQHQPGVWARGGYSTGRSRVSLRVGCSARPLGGTVSGHLDSGSAGIFLCEEDFAIRCLLVAAAEQLPKTPASPWTFPVRRPSSHLTEGSSASLSSRCPWTLNISPGGEYFYMPGTSAKPPPRAVQIGPGFELLGIRTLAGEFVPLTADLNSFGWPGPMALCGANRRAKLAELGKDEVSTVTRELHEYVISLAGTRFKTSAYVTNKKLGGLRTRGIRNFRRHLSGKLRSGQSTPAGN
uniref:VWFA domain-containing protein n=1 Tax=Macrostomum lignano TaxID=282301 RepID=A0A1I8FAF6_9PLAT